MTLLVVPFQRFFDFYGVGRCERPGGCAEEQRISARIFVPGILEYRVWFFGVRVCCKIGGVSMADSLSRARFLHFTQVLRFGMLLYSRKLRHSGWGPSDIVILWRNPTISTVFPNSIPGVHFMPAWSYLGSDDPVLSVVPDLLRFQK